MSQGTAVELSGVAFEKIKIGSGMDGTINAKTITYDFARLMEGSKEIRCGEFGDTAIAKL